MDWTGGDEALSQPHNDRQGHLKTSSDFLYKLYAILEQCHGSSSAKQAQFSSSNHCVIVPWCGQTLAFMFYGVESDQYSQPKHHSCTCIAQFYWQHAVERLPMPPNIVKIKCFSDVLVVPCALRLKHMQHISASTSNSKLEECSMHLGTFADQT